MGVGHGARLLGLRCDVLVGMASDAIVDLLEYFDPDLVYLAQEKEDMRAVSQIRQESDYPVIHAGRGHVPVQTETIAGTTFAFPRSADFIGGATTADGEGIPKDVDYVVSHELQIASDSVTMDATLEGLDHIARYQARTDGETTFLTGGLEASYDYVWQADVDGETVRLPVRGVAPLRRSGSPELACLTCDGDGQVAVKSAPADRFGLQALTEVGPAIAQQLQENGYGTRTAVAEATEQELREIRGIGDSKARAMRQSARALAEGRVVRLTNATVPAADHTLLFIDIETDGLSPSIIWLIGVYDPELDEYTDFIDTDPSLDDPGEVTREFITWLAAEYDRPSLISWNGHDFDYKHLERFIARHASEYLDYWDEHVFEYDLYDWAVTKGNAILPGRTNRIEDVAEALGCERESVVAAIDGKALARRVHRLLQSPDRAGELDWEAARAYGEADVRELVAVYDAIANATPGRERSDAPTDSSTTQTGLMDF